MIFVWRKLIGIRDADKGAEHALFNSVPNKLNTKHHHASK
jgi:hypothetical protein